MIATYVPPALTPVSRDAVARAFLWAMPAGANREAIALALAQSALETGRWKSCYNWCLGNAKAGPKYEGMYTSRLCNEVVGGKLRWFAPGGELTGDPDKGGRLLTAEIIAIPPGHPQTRFRAHANVWDGALEHVGLLEKRFGVAWQALLRGNVDAFIRALKTLGYFTADAGPYHKAVASLQREFLAVIDNTPDVPETDFDPELARLLRYADALQVESGREMWDEDTTPGDA